MAGHETGDTNPTCILCHEPHLPEEDCVSIEDRVAKIVAGIEDERDATIKFVAEWNRREDKLGLEATTAIGSLTIPP